MKATVLNNENEIKHWFFINGPSGAGKTTAVNTLEDIYSYQVLKVGPYFRSNYASSNSELNTLLINRIPIPNKYIEQFILEHISLKGSIIIVDGLPRSLENIDLIDKLTPKYLLPTFISINISFSTSLKRVLSRRNCENCGYVSSIAVCSHCGCNTSLRMDDAMTKIDVLSQRYYSMQSVIKKLSQKYKVYLIDGLNHTKYIVSEINGIILRTTQMRKI